MMNSKYEKFYNDVDLLNEPIPLREIHAIRLMLEDENKGLNYSERSKKLKETIKPIIDKFGLIVVDRAN